MKKIMGFMGVSLLVCLGAPSFAIDEIIVTGTRPGGSIGQYETPTYGYDPAAAAASQQRGLYEKKKECDRKRAEADATLASCIENFTFARNQQAEQCSDVNYVISITGNINIKIAGGSISVSANFVNSCREKAKNDFDLKIAGCNTRAAITKTSIAACF